MKTQGRFWKLDQNGYLQNDAGVECISPEFNPLIEAVKNTCIDHLGSSLHSFYLTGSISRGTAISKVSDLDTFAVLKKDHDLDTSWLSHTGKTLQSQYPVVSDIQLEIWKWNDLMQTDSLSEYQVILKLNSVCLWGDNLARSIPPIRPDYALALTELQHLQSDIDEVLSKIEKEPNQVAFWCKKIMKNLIRAGFYLLIPREKKFTRDLELSVATFLKYYPERIEINKCLKQVTFPLTHKKDLKKFLKSQFVKQLLDETKQLIHANVPTV
ncbi:nucleotidyltransferase family protein [Simkania negevensis]|uniref:Uncharacterized protein n=1 Tax=Simkania negevensis (strain ATCC VR-1471 / DSM 27360 / Z) TaxID=331113 RepID=F8L9B6_SIMNZ|nr:nucleotidyltransferase domain-containing protein [Simkania negevensis]CCB89437.1 hypothetical protein SNE_A15600 [Simkania negevensis Z]